MQDDQQKATKLPDGNTIGRPKSRWTEAELFHGSENRYGRQSDEPGAGLAPGMAGADRPPIALKCLPSDEGIHHGHEV